MDTLIISNTPIAESIHLLELSLSREFIERFHPGQFSMIRVTNTLDPLLNRPFSWAWIDPEKESGKILYRVVGRGTEILSEKRPGETLRISYPSGKGFPLPRPTNISPLFLVAGGIGIAPLLSIYTSYKLKNLTPVLLWGLKDSSHLFRLEAITQIFHDIPIHVATEDGSHGGFGGTAIDLLLSFQRKLDTPHCVVFACGPPAMLASVHEVFLRKRFKKLFVSLETFMACGTGLCMGCAVPSSSGSYLKVCQDGPVFEATSLDWTRLHEIL